MIVGNSQINAAWIRLISIPRRSTLFPSEKRVLHNPSYASADFTKVTGRNIDGDGQDARAPVMSEMRVSLSSVTRALMICARYVRVGARSVIVLLSPSLYGINMKLRVAQLLAGVADLLAVTAQELTRDSA